jgi:hypothetical protein
MNIFGGYARFSFVYSHLSFAKNTMYPLMDSGSRPRARVPGRKHERRTSLWGEDRYIS